MWSVDAWVMARPARAFAALAAARPGDGWWVGARRPLMLAVACGCLMSLCTTGTLTARLVGPATVYWAFLPLVELLALLVLIAGRRQRPVLPWAIDTFFAGHAPWTLLLLGIAATWAFLPPQRAWELLTSVWVWTALAVVAWSARIDFCYFRSMLGASRWGALRDVVICRALVWTAVLVVFAWPSLNGDGAREVWTELTAPMPTASSVPQRPAGPAP